MEIKRDVESLYFSSNQNCSIGSAQALNNRLVIKANTSNQVPFIITIQSLPQP
jgi:hypothetical protein